MEVEKIKYKESDISNVKALNSYCWNKPFYDEVTARSMAKAILALEKQIPKNVIYSEDKYNSTMAYCPCCDMLFDRYDWHWERHFCSYCGQRLHWEY